MNNIDVADSRDLMANKDNTEDGHDLIYIGPPAGGGHCVIRHKPDHSLELGVIRPLNDGESIHGEVISVEPCEGGWCKVTPIDLGHYGPANVNSKAFRDGWNNVFGQRMPAGEA